MVRLKLNRKRMIEKNKQIREEIQTINKKF